MTTRAKTRSPHRFTVLSLFAALAAGALGACATKGSAELSAQTADDSRVTEQTAPVASTAEPEPAPSATAPAPAPTQAAVYDGPSCPLACAILRPRSRVLAADEVERLRGALAPTMSGLRSCVYAQESDGRYHRPPPVNLRFSDNNDLLDVGVDPSGFEPNEEQCFMSVVRGGGAMPDVKLDGPATVRCSEHCERPHPIKKTAPARSPAPAGSAAPR